MIQAWKDLLCNTRAQARITAAASGCVTLFHEEFQQGHKNEDGDASDEDCGNLRGKPGPKDLEGFAYGAEQVHQLFEAFDKVCNQVNQAAQNDVNGRAQKVQESLDGSSQELAQLVPNGFFFLTAWVRAGAAAGRNGAVGGFILFMAAGALEDGVALLDKLARIVVFRGDGLLDLPVMAQGGKGVLFGLLAFGAGGELGAGDGTGGRSGVGFLPVVVAGGSCRAGTVDQVINRVVLLIYAPSESAQQTGDAEMQMTKATNSDIILLLTQSPPRRKKWIF